VGESKESNEVRLISNVVPLRVTSAALRIAHGSPSSVRDARLFGHVLRVSMSELAMMCSLMLV
jgi:hypothetical protein